MRAAALVAAGEALGARGIFGMAWVDRDLIVRRVFGRLAIFITRDEPVTDSLIPLFGLENDIRALSDESGRVLEIPFVLIRSPGAPKSHINIMMMWAPEAEQYLLVLSRSPKVTEIESQLAAEIRRRLIAERDATALARDLTRANRDLEEFASIVSHDLMSPLRGVRYLTDEVAAAIASSDAITAQQVIGRIREQSARLSDMLRSLFEYSRVGQKSDVATRVDSRAVVEAIVRSLPPRPGLFVTINGAWPVLDTLAQPLDLVLRNLIENAVKHHGGERVNIVIAGHVDAETMRITVSDDGPGIAPQHHSAIVLPFRRLNEKSADGTGMGLALVHRTLMQVGGRLEIDSDPARRPGAAFTVCWPLVISP